MVVEAQSIAAEEVGRIEPRARADQEVEGEGKTGENGTSGCSWLGDGRGRPEGSGVSSTSNSGLLPYDASKHFDRRFSQRSHDTDL